MLLNKLLVSNALTKMSSATSDAIKSEISALIGALQSVAQPLVRYVDSTSAIGGKGASEAVEDLKSTVNNIANSIKEAMGIRS